MHPHIPRGEGRIVVDDGDLLRRHPKLLGHDLGHDHVGTLADLRGTGHHRDAPEIVHLDDGATAVGAVDARPAAHVHRGRDADSAALHLRRLLLFAALPADALRRLLQALLQTTRGDLDPLGCFFEGAVHVAQAEFQRIHPNGLRQAIHLRLDDEGGLGIAEAAHRTGDGVVRVDAVGDHPRVRHAVQGAHGLHEHQGGDRAPGDIGAVVQQEFHIPYPESAIAHGSRPRPDAHGLAAFGGDELFLAGEDQAHRLPGLLRQPHADGLEGVHVQPAAEAAPDGRLDDADVAAGNSQRFGQVALQQERDLRRAPDGQVPRRVESRQAETGL